MATILNIVQKMIRETGLTEEEVLKFYRLFFETFGQRASQLEQNLSDRQFDRLGDYAHQLKGTAANLRMSQIAALSADLVEAAKKKEDPECARLIGEIVKLGNALKAQLNEDSVHIQ